MPSPWKDARGITVTTTPTIEGKPSIHETSAPGPKTCKSCNLTPH